MLRSPQVTVAPAQWRFWRSASRNWRESWKRRTKSRPRCWGGWSRSTMLSRWVLRQWACVCVGVSVAPFFACLCGGLMELTLPCKDRDKDLNQLPKLFWHVSKHKVYTPPKVHSQTHTHTHTHTCMQALTHRVLVSWTHTFWFQECGGLECLKCRLQNTTFLYGSIRLRNMWWTWRVNWSCTKWSLTCSSAKKNISAFQFLFEGCDADFWSAAILRTTFFLLTWSLNRSCEKFDIMSCSCSLRNMFWNWNRDFSVSQFQFEERVADLEAQLRLYKRQGDGDVKPYEHPHTHAIALERELDSMRERYKKQIAELTTQVEKLTGELTKLRKQQDSECGDCVALQFGEKQQDSECGDCVALQLGEKLQECGDCVALQFGEKQQEVSVGTVLPCSLGRSNRKWVWGLCCLAVRGEATGQWVWGLCCLAVRGEAAGVWGLCCLAVRGEATGSECGDCVALQLGEKLQECGDCVALQLGEKQQEVSVGTVLPCS